MFHNLLQMNILAPIVSKRPGGEMLQIMDGIDPDITIRAYIERMREDGQFDRLIPAIVEDLCVLREVGRLGGPIGSDEGFGFLAVWNEFVTGDPASRPDEECAALLAGPVLAMVESHAVLLCTKKKNAHGRIRPHHVEGQLEAETIERRLPDIEAALKIALTAGSSTTLDDGARTSREKNGEARVRLRDGAPIIEVKRKGAVDAWHEVALHRSPAIAYEDAVELAM